MQPNINNMQPYYNSSIKPATNFTGPVSNGAVLENNPLLKQAEKMEEGNTAILAGGVIGGTAALMWISEFVNKALRKDYAGTFFDKIEQWGNKLGAKPAVSGFNSKISGFLDKIKNSSFVQNSEVIKTIKNKPGIAGPMGQPQAYSVKGFLMGNALDALKNYSAMEAEELLKNYASNPSRYSATLNTVRNRLVNSPAQMQLLEQFIANPSRNLTAVLTEFKLPKNQQILREYAADPATYKDVIQSFKYQQSKNPTVLKALDDFIANPSDAKLLKKIIKSSDSLVLDKELAKLIKLAEKDSFKHKDKIIQKIEQLVAQNPSLKNKLLHSSGGSMFMPKWLVPKFMREKVTFSEILNKNRLINNYKTLKSPIGAKLSGSLFRSLEAATNGMVGGKMGVLMQAIFIGQSLKSAVDAPKGEKLSTFMEELVSMMAYTLTMGMQMRALNGAAGLKFLGMEEKDYKNYHRAVELAKKAAKSGDAKNYHKLTAIISSYETKANANLKPWQKPIKWFGKLLSIGRFKETVRPLKVKPKSVWQVPFTALRNTFAAIPHKLKTVGGFVGRTALIMAVISPIFSNWAVKISHKIFGKPTNSILDPVKTEETSAETTPAIPQQPPVPAAEPSVINYKPGNLIDMMNNKYRNPANTAQQQAPVTSQQQAPKPAAAGNLINTINKPASQPIASQSITNGNNEAPKIKRTYIPNPILGDETPVDPVINAKYNDVNAAILKADQAEAAARNFLNSL